MNKKQKHKARVKKSKHMRNVPKVIIAMALAQLGKKK